VAAAVKMGATPVPKQSNSVVSAMVDRGGLLPVPSPPFFETMDFLIEQCSFALSARLNTLSRMRLSIFSWGGAIRPYHDVLHPLPEGETVDFLTLAS
jgi:hypothetical protein